MYQTPRTYALVQVPVPHIVDGAPCPAHDERAEPKQTNVRQGRRERGLQRVRRHGNRPRYAPGLRFNERVAS